MWSIHEDLAVIFWDDIQDTGKMSQFSFYQRLTLLKDEVKAGPGMDQIKDSIM